jgi:hypothetical protein
MENDMRNSRKIWKICSFLEFRSSQLPVMDIEHYSGQSVKFVLKSLFNDVLFMFNECVEYGFPAIPRAFQDRSSEKLSLRFI